MNKASSILTITAAFSELQTYTTNQNVTHPEITECLAKQKDLPDLYKALGITDATTLNSKIKAYITANMGSTTKEFTAANKNWGSSAYSTSGSQVSAWFKKAISKWKQNEVCFFMFSFILRDNFINCCIWSILQSDNKF